MTIALARPRRFYGYRYALTGEISKYARWAQTLEIPADGASVSISGQTVYLTFRERPDDTSAVVTLSTTASDISITDADTLSLDVDPSDISSLQERVYYVDLTSMSGDDTTHWAHGSVVVRESPVAA